jgi:hypothetical protein
MKLAPALSIAAEAEVVAAAVMVAAAVDIKVAIEAVVEAAAVVVVGVAAAGKNRQKQRIISLLKVTPRLWDGVFF